MAIKDEIEKIKKNISTQDKECIGCDPPVDSLENVTRKDACYLINKCYPEEGIVDSKSGYRKE